MCHNTTNYQFQKKHFCLTHKTMVDNVHLDCFSHVNLEKPTKFVTWLRNHKIRNMSGTMISIIRQHYERLRKILDKNLKSGIWKEVDLQKEYVDMKTGSAVRRAAFMVRETNKMKIIDQSNANDYGEVTVMKNYHILIYLC